MLGGGLTATFALESFFRADTGEAGRSNTDAFFARNAYVGLEGGFGAVRLGRQATPLFETSLHYNAFGNSFGLSPVIRHTYTSGAVESVQGDTTWSNAIGYRSPVLGGFSTRLLVSAREGSSGRNLGATVGYVAGPVTINLTGQSVKTGLPGGTEERAWQLAGAWQTPLAKLFASALRVRDDAASTRTVGYSAGASMPLGSGFALLQWGTSKLEGAVDRRHTTTSIGYDHFLSKQTDAYVAVMHDTITSLDAGTTVVGGLRVRF